MRCECRVSGLDFTGWQRFQDAANVGNRGFGSIPADPGVYCIRAARCGETNPDKIIEAYRGSPLYAAFCRMGDASEDFFQRCHLGTEWGWKWYATYADERLKRIRSITYDDGGQLTCLILYIGCSKSLQSRMRQLMDLEHTLNHPLWALLYSEWKLELAVQVADGYKGEEARLKQEYRNAHQGRLPPLMQQ
jgi:hypothetical protein